MGSWLFEEDEITSKKPSALERSTDTLTKMGCKACSRNRIKSLKHPKMKATGSKHPLIYALGESPSQKEDNLGRHSVGKEGELLREHIPERIYSKIRWNNITNCMPEKKAPTPKEITCCRSRIVADIERTKPKAIFGFGGLVLSWAIGEQKIDVWAGRRIPVKIGNHTCYYFPFYHPGVLIKKRRRPQMWASEHERTFAHDIKRAIEEVKNLPDAVIVEEEEIKSGVEIFTGEGGWKDVKRIRAKLEYYGQLPDVAFDYETASDEKGTSRQVRPYGKNARILSVSVGTEEDVIAFPFYKKGNKWTGKQFKAVWQAWMDFLSSSAKKIAHQLFFELEWTTFFFGKELARVSEWHDSMAQAYVLSKRRGSTNLDALTLANFGFRLKDMYPVNLSNLDAEPIEKVLRYNALDSKWTHALFHIQKYDLEYEGLWNLYLDHIRRIPSIVLKSHFGMLIDFDSIMSFDAKYSPKIIKLEKWFANTNAAAKFEKRQGKPFSPSSPADVLVLLSDILGRKECEVGEDEWGNPKYSTEDDVLGKIPLKIARKLQEYRAIRGNKSKYVDPLFPKNHKPEVTVAKDDKGTGKYIWPDGMTHAAIKTLFIVSNRTSCEFPNEQFWPKRNENYTDLRNMFVSPTRDVLSRIQAGYDYQLPSHMNEDDCWLVVIDYGQIQARIAGMVSKDEMYCKYLWDRNDLHMHWTKLLAQAYPKRIGGKRYLKDPVALKTFRTDVKNQWTFPLIFGARSSSVANYLKMPEKIVKPMMKEFFRQMPGLEKWQKRIRKFYDKEGYVETPNGFRRYGPMDHGEVINTPIQGGEAEIVLDAMNRLSEAAQELDNWTFQARLEVHDELAFWVPKKTADRDIEFIADHMLECEHYDWINVPLAIEISKGPNWYDQEEVATLFSDDFGKIDRKEMGF